MEHQIVNEEVESPESWKLFVGQIPRNIRHEDLVVHFSEFGELQEVFVIRDQSTGSSKGCCFVRYRYKQAAERCIEEMNDKFVFPGSTNPAQVSFAAQNNGNSVGRVSPMAGGGGGMNEFESKLFVGQLPQTFAEADLSALFEPYGAVREVYVMRHRDSGLSKGAGFVRLEADPMTIKTAITELNGKILEGSPVPIKVDYAHQKTPGLIMMSPRNGMGMMGPNGHQQAMRYTTHVQAAPMMAYPGGHAATWYHQASQMDRKNNMNLPKLFVGGLTVHTTEAQLMQIFSHYGQVREVVILRYPNGQSKASGFVKYSTEEEANVAVMSLSNRYSLPGSNRPLSVKYAGIANNPPEHKLFVGHLPLHFDENQTEGLFGAFGEVTEVHVMRDQRGQNRGSAFVKFVQRSQAEAAIQALHGSTQFGERPLKVSFALTRSTNSQQLMNPSTILQQLQPTQGMQHMHQQQPQRVMAGQGNGPQGPGQIGGPPDHIAPPMQHAYAFIPHMAQYFSLPAGADGSSQLPVTFS